MKHGVPVRGNKISMNAVSVNEVIYQIAQVAAIIGIGFGVNHGGLFVELRKAITPFHFVRNGFGSMNGITPAPVLLRELTKSQVYSIH